MRHCFVLIAIAWWGMTTTATAATVTITIVDPITVTTQTSQFDGLTFADPFSLTLTATGGTSPYTWSITAGALPAGLALNVNGAISGTPSAGGAASFTVRATDQNQSFGTRSFDVSVYPVPKPKPIDISHSFTTIYMPKPSWPSHQWADLRMVNEKNQSKAAFGQRMPLLGYYQGDSPEVLDWQIKMAVDRGITNFMFDDYWVENVDHPIYDTASSAFLSARYRDSMSFAMLFNFCDTVLGTDTAKQACFLNKVLPYYVSHYFTQPNYLRIEGRPVIQFLDVGLATGEFVPAEIAAFLAAADQYIDDNSPYPGAYWIASDTIGGTYPEVDFSRVAAAGFKAVSPYYVLPFLWPAGGWHLFPIDITHSSPVEGNNDWPEGVPYGDVVSHSQSVHQAAFVEAGQRGLKFITSIAPDFDSRAIWFSLDHLYFKDQNHVDYWNLLSWVRAFAILAYPNALPVSTNTGKPLVGLGPWNEQIESSTVEPGYSTFQRPGGGNGDPFFMATAAAKVFGGPPSYDEYLPGDHSRGFPANKNNWTFSSLTGAGLDEWNAVATAGLSIGPGDVLVVTGANRVRLSTPTNVSTVPYTKVKVLVRVDEGAARLQYVQLHTMSSDYSENAHLFGAPEEPGKSFYGPLYQLDEWVYVPMDGFREYTFNVAAAPQYWQGILKSLELRFEVTPSGSPQPMRYSLKRVWLE